MEQHTQSRAGWYATRTVPMPDDGERGVASVLIWMERREGGGWAVGRASDLDQREHSAPRQKDYVFEGFELQDALDAANSILEQELEASERDGLHPDARPFTRSEVQTPLNEWFWGRRGN